jgi:hypothetical protein
MATNSGSTTMVAGSSAPPKHGLIATGQSGAVRGHWYRLELAFHGERISGRIDGSQVFEVLNARHLAGMAGFGTGCNLAEFDDPTLDPVSAGVPVISAPPKQAVRGTRAAPK